MPGQLPEQRHISIGRGRKTLTRSSLDRVEYLILLVPLSLPSSRWRALPYAALLKRELERARSTGGSERHHVIVRLPNTRQTLVSVVACDATQTSFDVLTHMRRALAELMKHDPGELHLSTHEFPPEHEQRFVEAAVLAALASAFEMPSFKSKPSSKKRLRAIRLTRDTAQIDTARIQAESEGNNLARWLTALPPSELTAESYRKRVEGLAAQHEWKMRFLDERALKRRGAGAFLAVSQGNATRDAGIIHLSYSPQGGGRRRKLGLVGKGICFDTGGTNLKPFKGMLDMHEDMQGSAVALGALTALSRLGIEYPVECWLAVTENRLGPTAYKSQDVVTASNGTTVQVIHTDAEGRMVLADTLALASREQPQAIIDYATLTGACVGALTNRYSGVFTNRPSLQNILVAAGRESGERVWPFPMDSDFDSDLDSSVADVMQCSVDSNGDHILAARFLNRFVPPEQAWIHIDLAAGHRKGGLAQIPTNITGFGVRYTLNLLLEQGLLDRLTPGA